MKPDITCVVDARNKLGEGPVWCLREQVLYWVDIEGCKLQCWRSALGEKRIWQLPERMASFALR